MKKQTGAMLIEDMDLKVGERFQIGEDNDPKKWFAKYVGVVKKNGKIYDEIKPVK